MEIANVLSAEEPDPGAIQLHRFSSGAKLQLVGSGVYSQYDHHHRESMLGAKEYSLPFPPSLPLRLVGRIVFALFRVILRPFLSPLRTPMYSTTLRCCAYVVISHATAIPPRQLRRSRRLAARSRVRSITLVMNLPDGKMANVSVGSKADLTAPKSNFRFAPESR